MNIKNCPLVNIVMLNYNGLAYLKQTIKSILELDYQNFEFIVVDNGSTDGSLDYIKSFGEKIHLLQSPRPKEKNFACNYAINKAKGEYILLLDNDVLVKEKKLLDDLLDYYKILKKPGFITISLQNLGDKFSNYYGGYFSLFFIKQNKLVPVDTLPNFHGSKIGFPHGANIFFKKNFWKIIGGYDQDLMFSGDDTDIGLKSIIFGYNNYLFSKYSNIHLGSKNNESNSIFFFKFKNIIYSHLSNIFTNYDFINMTSGLLFFSGFVFLKSIKQSFFRLSLIPFFSFFYSNYLFFRNILSLIDKRKIIQSNRVIKKDVFLKIKPINLI